MCTFAYFMLECLQKAGYIYTEHDAAHPPAPSSTMNCQTQINTLYILNWWIPEISSQGQIHAWLHHVWTMAFALASLVNPTNVIACQVTVAPGVKSKVKFIVPFNMHCHSSIWGFDIQILLTSLKSKGQDIPNGVFISYYRSLHTWRMGWMDLQWDSEADSHKNMLQVPRTYCYIRPLLPRTQQRRARCYGSIHTDSLIAICGFFTFYFLLQSTALNATALSISKDTLLIHVMRPATGSVSLAMVNLLPTKWDVHSAPSGTSSN